MKVTKRDRILLAVLGVVAVLGGFWWFVVKPASADLQAERDRLEAVRDEAGAMRDTLSRYSVSTRSDTARAAERLRLAKALPDGADAPGAIVQLQRLADRANVELTSIKTNSYTDYGSIRGTELEVRITGRFFDVDDFLYRLHRQVAVDEKDRPIIGGRLFATVSLDLNLVQGEADADGDQVVGTVKVVAFSSVPGGAASSVVPAPAAGTPVAAPAPAATTTATAAPAAAAAPGGSATPDGEAAGEPQTVSSPSTGGSQ
ncbi:type II secretion system protein GspM [Miltoncostaea marina]|uniref:type II secretion system protein GspM n=1 Tax=Miltoncostaea marina TaxID=2843215 RepID=UPI001C3DCBE2|nr:type II secretion system protein GspM [Miltoncostaea marina]